MAPPTNRLSSFEIVAIVTSRLTANYESSTRTVPHEQPACCSREGTHATPTTMAAAACASEPEPEQRRQAMQLKQYPPSYELRRTQSGTHITVLRGSQKKSGCRESTAHTHKTQAPPISECCQENHPGMTRAAAAAAVYRRRQQTESHVRDQSCVEGTERVGCVGV